MGEDILKYAEINRPMYVLEEDKLRGNLALIQSVAQRAGVEIILAFKAYALWKTFPIFREYIHSTTASSLSEARLAHEEFGAKPHTYSPAYTDYEIRGIAECSSHLTFNSLSQYNRYHELVKTVNPQLSLGLRINPEYSEVETELYNPCMPGTRFGITAGKLPEELPSGVEGFHCHCLCESGADVFERTLRHVEERFSPWLSQLKWINFGGGHLITRNDYNVELLVKTLQNFHGRYPWLEIVLEPGSAFAWQTGVLVAQVVDIVEDQAIKTAILNVSFTCHMPDCLEMPYWPKVLGGRHIDENLSAELKYVYRLGGNSCLSGDYMGSWQFDHPLQIGENVIFDDMIHYTTVKTNMFNGITHPAIALLRIDGTLDLLRAFDYIDYKMRMD